MDPFWSRNMSWADSWSSKGLGIGQEHLGSRETGEESKLVPYSTSVWRIEGDKQSEKSARGASMCRSRVH